MRFWHAACHVVHGLLSGPWERFKYGKTHYGHEWSYLKHLGVNFRCAWEHITKGGHS